MAEIIIIGASPAGLYLARNLARGPHKITVMEALSKTNYFGRLDSRADVISLDALKESGYVPAITHTAGRFIGSAVKSGEGGFLEKHRMSKLTYYFGDTGVKCENIDYRAAQIDRRRFADMQHKECNREMVNIEFGTTVTGLSGELDAADISDIKVDGVYYQRAGETFTAPADLVIDASSCSSGFLSGISALQIRHNGASPNNAYKNIRRVDIDAKYTGLRPFGDFYIGYKDGAEWLLRYDSGEAPISATARYHALEFGIAELGAALSDKSHEELAAHIENSRKNFNNLYGYEESHYDSKLYFGEPREIFAVAGFMALGAAAGISNPFTGCAFTGAFASAHIAGEVIVQAAEFDFETAYKYNCKWQNSCGSDYFALSRLKSLMWELDDGELEVFINKCLTRETFAPMLTDVYAPDPKRLKTVADKLQREKFAGIIKACDKVYNNCKKFPKAYSPKAFFDWQKRLTLL